MATIAKLLAKAELDTSGFQKGITVMETSVDKMATTSIKGVTTAAAKVSKLGTTFTKVGAAGAAMFRVIALGAAVLLLSPIFLLIKAVSLLIGVMAKSLKAAFTMTGKNMAVEVQDIKNSMLELEVAFANMFAPLIIALLPTIKLVINWLINLFNLVAMITAAFLGQAEVMQVIVGSVNESANGMNSLRKNTLGALAAFDQLNVLTQDAVSVDDVATEMVPISAEILNDVNAIKQGWEEIVKLWDDAWKGWGEFMKFMDWAWQEGWEQIKVGWGMASDWFDTNVWKPITEGSTWTWKDVLKDATWYEVLFRIWALGLGEILRNPWESLLLAVSTLSGAIGGVLIVLLAWVLENFIGPLIILFHKMWNSIVLYSQLVIEDVLEKIRGTWDALPEWFRTEVIDPIKIRFWEGFADIRHNFSLAWSNVKTVWGVARAWFGDNVTDPLKTMFGTSLDWIDKKFKDIFGGIKVFVKIVANSIIDALNGMIQGIASTINAFINTANSIGSIIPGYVFVPNVSAPIIPHLAEGAVIPPNAPFTALLGDQKSGTNIEAPESLIRDIIRQELGNIKTDVRIEFGGSLGALVRELKPFIDKETTRIGKSLISRSGALS